MILTCGGKKAWLSTAAAVSRFKARLRVPASQVGPMCRAECALITDTRFSGGTSVRSIGHVFPRQRRGDAIGFVEDGDFIEIVIPGRSLQLLVNDYEFQVRAVELLGRFRDGADADVKAGRPFGAVRGGTAQKGRCSRGRTAPSRKADLRHRDPQPFTSDRDSPVVS